MRTVAAVVFCFLAFASTSFAQTPDPCEGVTLNPYTQGGNSELTTWCADRGHLAQPVWMPATCIRPYPGFDTWLCPSGTPRAPIVENSAYRYAIVQASVGHPGREYAFVILLNLSDVAQQVVLEYVIEGRQGTYITTRTLQPNERAPIGLHADPMFVGRAYFSVVVSFEKPGAVEMAWHRSPDAAEVATKPGMLIP